MTAEAVTLNQQYLQSASFGGRSAILVDVDISITYLAGLFDGEGTAAVQIQKSGAVSSALVMGMLDRWLLEDIAQQYGGKVYPDNRRGAKHAGYRWYLGTAGALYELLPRLIPHIRIKRDEMEALLALACHVYTRSQGRYPAGHPWKIEQVRLAQAVLDVRRQRIDAYEPSSI